MRTCPLLVSMDRFAEEAVRQNSPASGGSDDEEPYDGRRKESVVSDSDVDSETMEQQKEYEKKKPVFASPNAIAALTGSLRAMPKGFSSRNTPKKRHIKAVTEIDFTQPVGQPGTPNNPSRDTDAAVGQTAISPTHKHTNNHSLLSAPGASRGGDRSSVSTSTSLPPTPEHSHIALSQSSPHKAGLNSEAVEMRDLHVVVDDEAEKSGKNQNKEESIPPPKKENKCCILL